MTRIVKILGIDPALRNTGLGLLTYDFEKNEISVSDCLVVRTPQSIKGASAILHMIDQLDDAQARYPSLTQVDAICVESPAVLFLPKASPSAMISIAHISGAAAALFDLGITHLYRPVEWTKRRRKDHNQSRILEVLGQPDEWQYLKKVTTQTGMEHIIDALGIALHHLQTHYLAEDDEESDD